jgi:AAA15 family ATPase/GTPase
VIDAHSCKLLRSIVVYGANSSGKSNVIKAFNHMKNCVWDSIRLNSSDPLVHYPFLLSSVENEPTFFEIIFLDEKQQFRYGFEYDSEKIVSEWLFAGEELLFVREFQNIEISERGQFEEGNGKEKITNRNRLFLSLVAQLNGEISNRVMDCFGKFNCISGIKHGDYSNLSLKMFEEQSTGYKESMELFQKLQLGFKGIKVLELELDTANSSRYKLSDVKSNHIEKFPVIYTIHNQYDEQGRAIGTISWPQDDLESDGTKKIMDLAGPIFDTLLNGSVLIIDELDAKLHPLITMHIVSLFNNPLANPKNAQLLFATHDTNLLNLDIFRKDQIWFTEKDKMEQTDLYSLNDFVFPDKTEIKKDKNLKVNYINGRYGAIPYIRNENYEQN